MGDIERYHKGLLSHQEMNELEKAALDDPFLADALEGYAATPANISSDLSELKKKLDERVSERKVISMAPSGNSFKWWKVAAAIVILGGVGFLTFKLSTRGKQNSIAEVNEKKASETPATVIVDSNKKTTIDSTSIAKNRNEGAITTANSVNKHTVKSTQEKADTTNSAGRSSISRTSATPGIATVRKQNIDSFNEKSDVEVRTTAAPLPVKKAESRAAQPAGVVNEEQARVQPQTNNFTGRVLDANKNAIPFANITGTRNKVETYADASGYFSLASPDSVLNVRVRSVGFENGVIDLKNNGYNQVVLHDDKTAEDKIFSFKNSEVNESRASDIQVDQPEPVDGWTNYNRYLANNIDVADDLKKRYDNGQVELSFDVNDSGVPMNIKVDKSLCKKCDAEIVRVVQQGPKWRKKNKDATKVTLTVPFHAR